MAAPYIFTYSPSNMIFSIGGYLILGWDRISIERNTPVTKQIRGIRGKNTKIRNKDTSCKITLELAQTSEANLVLSRALEFDVKTGNLRFECMIKEVGGGSVFQSNEVYIEGYPAVTFSGDLEKRVWTLLCDSSSWDLKGNVANSSSIIEKAKEKLGNLF